MKKPKKIFSEIKTCLEESHEDPAKAKFLWVYLLRLHAKKKCPHIKLEYHTNGNLLDISTHVVYLYFKKSSVAMPAEFLSASALVFTLAEGKMVTKGKSPFSLGEDWSNEYRDVITEKDIAAATTLDTQVSYGEVLEFLNLSPRAPKGESAIVLY